MHSDGARTIAESGAILEYIAAKYGQGRLVPAEGTEDKLRYTYFMQYAEGSLMPLMVMKLVLGAIPHNPMPFFIRPIAKKISQGVDRGFIRPQAVTNLAFIESELKQRPWFAGDTFSVADVQMSFPLEAASVRAGLDRTTHPKTFAWLDTIHARPAYKRALERGGKFELAAF